MDVLIAVLLAGGIISIGAHLLRGRREGNRQREDQPTADGVPRASDRPLELLRPNDVVVAEQGDLIVERVARLLEGSTRWIEARLKDGDRRFCLVVHPSDPDHALFGCPEEASTLIVAGDQPPDSVDLGGRIYQLGRCGQATAKSVEGVDTDLTTTTSVWAHWEYVRPGARRLWLRRVEGRWHWYAGERVARHLLEVIPA